jgi:hypothetical protein
MAETANGLRILDPAHNRGYFELRAEQDVGRTQFGTFVVQVPPGGQRLEGILGYRRCFDFDMTDGAGQDYAVLRGDSQYFVGVLADGVSQSFFGDIAATQVSEFLIDHLWNLRQKPPRKQDLEYELKRLEKVAAETVRRRPIPADIPPMQRTALEKGKAKGSQAVFAAFVLDNRSQTVQVYQCGDVRSMVFRDFGSPPITVRADANGRWSTAGLSDLMLQSFTYDGIEQVYLASDGVTAGWEQVLQRDGSCQDSMEAMVREQAAKDDVSFLTVRYGAAVPTADPPSVKAAEAQKLASNVVWVDGSDSAPSAKPRNLARPSGDRTPPRTQSSPDRTRPAQSEVTELKWPPNQVRGTRLINVLWMVLVFVAGLLTGLYLALDRAPNENSSQSKRTSRGSSPKQEQQPPPLQAPFVGPREDRRSRPAGRFGSAQPSASGTFQINAKEITHWNVIREYMDTVQPMPQSAMIRLVCRDLQGYQVGFSSSARSAILPNPIDIEAPGTTNREYSAVVYIKGLPEQAKTPLTVQVTDPENGSVAKSVDMDVEPQKVYALTIQRFAP